MSYKKVKDVICELETHKFWFVRQKGSHMVVMFQFVCPERDPHFKELSKLHVLFHTMNNTNHIFIN